MERDAAKHALPLGAEVWGDTLIELPRKIAGVAFRNAMTQRTVEAQTAAETQVLSAAVVFSTLPVALLISSPAS